MVEEIKVKVRLFALYREELKTKELERSVPVASTAKEVWELVVQDNSRLRAMGPSTRFAINSIYSTNDAVLHDGDELAFIPPVSGGSVEDYSHYCEIVAEPISVAKLISLVESPANGGIVTFVGVVRDNNEGRTVSYLEYEAFEEMAFKIMQQIVAEVQTRWGFPVALSHRLGRLEIGEASVAIVAASPHRAEAFAACEYAIDRLKEIVPIWKKEHFSDGAVWIGSAQQPPNKPS